MKKNELSQNTDWCEDRNTIIDQYTNEVVQVLESAIECDKKYYSRKKERSVEEINFLEKHINALAKMWYEAKTADKIDEAARHRGDLLLLVLLCYNEHLSPNTRTEENRTDAFMSALDYVMTAFDPEQGNFTHFLSRTWKFRFKDAETKYGEIESLDQPISAEDGRTALEMLSAQTDPQDIYPHTLEASLFDLLSQMLNFAERKDSSSITSEKLEWYKAFLAEDITAAAKCAVLEIPVEMHESDCFRAMDTKYLDSYMDKTCRTYQAITDTPLKTYEGFSKHINIDCPWNEKKRTNRIKVPLEKQMACYYFGKSQVARGPHYRSYTELKKKIIES